MRVIQAGMRACTQHEGHMQGCTTELAPPQAACPKRWHHGTLPQLASLTALAPLTVLPSLKALPSQSSS